MEDVLEANKIEVEVKDKALSGVPNIVEDEDPDYDAIGEKKLAELDAAKAKLLAKMDAGFLSYD